MNACVTLLFLWPSSYAVPTVEVRALPAYKTWIVALQDGPDTQRALAAQGLRAYGRHALPALAALRLGLQKTDEPLIVREMAATIVALGPEASVAAPDLNATRRTFLQFAMAMLDPTADRLDELAKPLLHADFLAVCAIWQQQRLPHDKLLPALRARLRVLQKDGSMSDAAAVATACLRLDPTCAEALHAFRKGIGEADRAWLRRAGQLGANAKPLLPALLAAYRDDDLDDTDRLDLLQTLNHLGPHAASLAPALAKMQHGRLTPYVAHTLRASTREARP